jgi:hypothetical protein
MSMQVLIQELSSGLFYKAKTEWVRSKARARAFDDLQAAIKFCLEQTMPDVRLLVSFENPEHDFYLQPFGQDELAAETQELLARNGVLQQEQWALSSQVGTAVAKLERTRKDLRPKPEESAGSPVERQQSVA